MTGSPWRCAKALASHRCSPGSIPGLVCGKALSFPCRCPVVFLQVFFHPHKRFKILSYKPVRVGRVLDLHSGDVKHTFIFLFLCMWFWVELEEHLHWHYMPAVMKVSQKTVITCLKLEHHCVIPWLF